MDNHIDEETVRRWKSEDTTREQRTVNAYEKTMGVNPPKRRRLENGNASESVAADGVIEIPRREISKIGKGRNRT